MLIDTPHWQLKELQTILKTLDAPTLFKDACDDAVRCTGAFLYVGNSTHKRKPSNSSKSCLHHLVRLLHKVQPLSNTDFELIEDIENFRNGYSSSS